MSGQSRKGSALEVLFPMFGVHVSTSQNVALVAIYTVISVARQYAFRRIANWFLVRG
jgi:hypothetical protein